MARETQAMVCAISPPSAAPKLGAFPRIITARGKAPARYPNSWGDDDSEPGLIVVRDGLPEESSEGSAS